MGSFIMLFLWHTPFFHHTQRDYFSLGVFSGLINFYLVAFLAYFLLLNVTTFFVARPPPRMLSLFKEKFKIAEIVL